MKFLRTAPLFAATLIFAIVACSTNESPTANGTGSNAGETEIAGVFTINSNGKSFANATARIWIMAEDSMFVAYEKNIDSTGVLKYNEAIHNKYNAPAQLLEMRSGDSLSTMRWVDLKRNPSQQFNIESSETLDGIISNNGSAVEGVTIRILDKSTITDADGKFEIQGLPAGVHYAFLEGFFGKLSYQMQTGLDENGKTNDINIADSIFTVIEDFENWKSRRTLIGKSFGQGWWFISTDSLQGGGSRASAGISSDEILVTGDTAKTGSSLHIAFDIDETFEGHYGVAGFSIGDDFDEDEMFAFYDLRNATAISFDAKGSGKIAMQITKRSQNGEREYHETQFIPLSEKWEHFTFTADDFNTKLTAVNTINFLIINDADIYLDNIRLDGISPSMWPSLGMRF